jgi:hypothetical protein
MKKYAFNLGIKYEVNASLFQKGKKIYNIALYEAPIFGNIKMLKHIYEFNKNSNLIFSLHNYTLSNAALSGNIECLVYAHKVIGAKDSHHFTLESAALSGNIECLVYAHKVIGAKDINCYTLSNAALSGNIKCLVYTHKVIGAKDSRNLTLKNAIKSENIECITYCNDNFIDLLVW